MSEEKPDLTPMSSPMNDVRKLKANSAASADELISWLSRMRGKPPGEVLGQVANSHLFKSFIQAAFLMAFLVLAWTAAAWGYENYVKKDDTALPDPVEKKVATEAAVDEEGIPDNVADPNKAKMPDLDTGSKQKAVEKLGIGEVKEAPANFNPLDNGDDDLLKDLQ
jgi:hypothetical protein